MSALDVASVVLEVLPTVIQALVAQRNRLKSSKGTDELKSLELDLKVGYRKFKTWQERWLGQKYQPDASSEALWGADGWANVQKMLRDILQISHQLKEAYTDIQPHADSQPRSRWKLALMRLKRRHDPSIKELKELITELSLAVDSLWLYSETVFDSLHGVLAPGLRIPIRDLLLKSALQSRPGSLQLYKLCCNDSTDCILELDLRPDSDLKDRAHTDDGTSHLLYQLFARTPNDSTKLRKLVVQNVPHNDVSPAKSFDILGRGDSSFQLFKINSSVEGIIIPVEREGAISSSCLRIEKPFLEHVQLKSTPESLGKVLKRLRETDLLSPREHFSVGAKVELAYKIVESGIFLLGTPWFSLLTSQNLLRIKDAHRARPSFGLEVQTFGLVDLLFDDSEALSETKQLFHVGALLMEIALDGPGASENAKGASRPTNLLNQLPLVEQAMGAQYCKATAFCLQHCQHKQRFYGLENYEGAHSSDWQRYLSELLQDYYSQVFLRLEELREIDTKSEYRSRKSWLIEES